MSLSDPAFPWCSKPTDASRDKASTSSGSTVRVLPALTGFPSGGGGACFFQHAPEGALETAVKTLHGGERLGRLLEYTREWNTNSRHADLAAATLNAVLKTHAPSTLAALPNVHDLTSALQVRAKCKFAGIHSSSSSQSATVQRSPGPALSSG